jgi:hypothetical protein
MIRWKTTYTEIAHANEEVLSDNVRKAYPVIILAWLVTIVLLFVAEFQQDTPSPSTFLYNAGATTVAIGLFYLALVGLRYFAHRRPHHWHLMNWGAIWLFLIGAIVYFVVDEGFGVNAIVTFSVLVSVWIYHWMMHHATVWWEVTPQGVSEHIKFLGHTQSAHTSWKEVKRHWVHPLTGAVQLRLKWHRFRIHIAPHVHLVVPDTKLRKQIHAELKKILWKRGR